MRKSQLYRSPHRLKKNQPIFRRRLFWISISLFILTLGLIYVLFLSNIFQINNITISGLEKIPAENVKEIVGKRSQSNILFFKTKSIFLANLDEMKEELMDYYPQIREVKIQRRFVDGLNVKIMERQSNTIWCLLKEERNQCFALDSFGIIFEERQPDGNFPLITDATYESVLLGDSVIEAEGLEAILMIRERIEGMQIAIKEFLILQDRFTLITMEGWEAYFNLDGDIDWQLTKLNAVLQEKIQPERRLDLEYIELRFGNLAPFKYRQLVDTVNKD